jgi:DNA-binding IclR family transcriptional regulator
LIPDEQARTNDEELDPVVVTVLLQLWTAWQESPDKPWSLPKLCKRAELAMSTLRRTLTRLAAAGFIEVTTEDDERATAKLSSEGVEFCNQLFHPE